ncbi:MAG TPA: hypothetical protein PK829_05380 [Promineifilum sp.]|nr:hypothetical protein [Promineifilum sp.]
MNNSAVRWLIIIALALVLGLLLWWLLGARDVGAPGETDTPGDTTQCPQATPEFFTVEPVTSPTDALTQIITVDLGNGEAITVTTESGVFTVPFDAFPKEIEITLLPNTTHNLTVEGKVRQVQQGDCTYGGYTLTTTTDRNGAPLVIEQNSGQ